jgi:hypothetical protein
MRERLEKEFASKVPWAKALSVPERECLLTMLRKMCAATGPARPDPGDEWRVTADEPATTGGDPATDH